MGRARGVQTRPFRSSDKSFVRELSGAAFGEYSRDSARSTLEMAERWTCVVAELVDPPRPGSTSFAKEPSPPNARAVGFVVLRAERGELAEVQAIAVVEEERGRGLGRALLEAAERSARAAGASGMLLHTADANLAAFELFVKSGFRIRRRILRYYRNVYDACELQKDW